MEFWHLKTEFWHLNKSPQLEILSILKLVKLQSLVAKCCKMENIALQSSQILYTFALRAEIPTTFRPKMVARNTKYTKFATLCKAIFSAFYNISQPNFANLLILVCSF
jgi:hypothetical protein